LELHVLSTRFVVQKGDPDQTMPGCSSLRAYGIFVALLAWCKAAAAVVGEPGCGVLGFDLVTLYNASS
jgi:hypothetical protein